MPNYHRQFLAHIICPNRRNIKLMKIQFLNGGLANQAFQYIFARHYELSHPGDTMYMDDSYFALNTVHNGYELEKVFGIHPHMLSSCFDERVWNFILDARQKEHKSVPQILMENQIPIDMVSEVGEECHRFNPFEGRRFHVRCHQYCPEVFAIPEAEENIYYHGYWLNTAWFAAYRDIFLKEFRFPEITDERNLHYLNEITSSPSVSIHIRRGDYITLNMAPPDEVYSLCAETFFVQYGGDWNLFVFSDDIPWCKEHAQDLQFNLFKKVTFVEGNIHGENYRDMQLMSQCQAMIMSNSAFCFLAALLNTRREIVLNLTDRDIL